MIDKLKNNISETQATVIIIAITFILAIIIWRAADENEDQQNTYRPRVHIHTKIPRGFNLYALDIANIDSINALVDNYALVNIYQVTKNKYSKLILQRIKLIRSLKDNNHFAILATNDDLDVITKYPGPFKVALQNPDAPTALVKKKTQIKNKRTIIAEDRL